MLPDWALFSARSVKENRQKSGPIWQHWKEDDHIRCLPFKVKVNFVMVYTRARDTHSPLGLEFAVYCNMNL